MPENRLRVLLDQNIPQVIADWLGKQRPAWVVQHVNELDLHGQPDEVIYRWAQENGSLIVTYDEDFADARMYPLGHHHGVVRLRVWPTTIEETQSALSRLLEGVPEGDWPRSLIIVDARKIRVRSGRCKATRRWET